MRIIESLYIDTFFELAKKDIDNGATIEEVEGVLQDNLGYNITSHIISKLRSLYTTGGEQRVL